MILSAVFIAPALKFMENSRRRIRAFPLTPIAAAPNAVIPNEQG
jgi:hypothetical protein